MTSQIILFAQSRSASHLLERIISKQQPDVINLYNPLGESRGIQLAWLRSDDFAVGMPAEQLSNFEQKVRNGVDKWEEGLATVKEEGKKLLIHTHPFNPAAPARMLAYINHLSNTPSAPLPAQGENFTLLPPSLLLREGTVPLFTIRDPRLVAPSAHRVLSSFGLPHGGGRPNFLIATNLIWARLLYDWYVSQGVEPLVVEADDVMTSEAFVRKVCERCGLDPYKACFEWEAQRTEAERGDMHPMFYLSQKTLVESAGVKADLAGSIQDFEKVEAGWKDEFDEDEVLVREMVGLAKPHYEYLFERRLLL